MLQNGERKPYTRREVIVILIIVVAGTLIVGTFNSTTESIQTVSSGPLSISLNVNCSGFGEPTYYSTLDPEINYTTYAYGHCFFGFWLSNGNAVPSTLSTGEPLLAPQHDTRQD